VTNRSLAASYLQKAEVRLEVVALLRRRGAHSDVIREAQELVELPLKGMLRAIGVEPPRVHDVGSLLLEHREKFPEAIRRELDRAADISKGLRKERELAFYGDVDFIPTEEYSAEDAERAEADARWTVAVAAAAIRPASRG
jgi:HEPN domain-containing protein